MLNSLTVVMLNWARPWNVKDAVYRFADMPIVKEIIVCDGAERSLPLIGLTSKPVTVYQRQYGRDAGLVTRFTTAALSTTAAVLLVDDDIVLPEHTVVALYQRWREIGGVHGLIGRNLHNGRYNFNTVYGSCDIVLTRACVTSRRLCIQSILPTIEMYEQLGGSPPGNGEDIVLSHVAAAGPFQRVAHRLEFTNKDATDHNSISVRTPDHLAHRQRVIDWLRKTSNRKLGEDNLTSC